MLHHMTRSHVLSVVSRKISSRFYKYKPLISPTNAETALKVA